MASTDLGRDLSGTDDLNPNMIEVDGTLMLSQALYRRLVTQRGSLYRSPEYGEDIREAIGTEAYPDQLRRRIEAELINDARVKTIDSTVVLVDTPELEIELQKPIGTMIIEITGESTLGPFSFVVGVDDVTVELLELS